MFSSRTTWNITPNQISTVLAEKRRRGEVIIDLTESNPTLCKIRYPEKEILNALASSPSMIYQPEPRGLLAARKSVADYYSSIGITVVPERIMLTASTSEAYSFLFKLLCNAGDEIIVPRPGYPLFEYLCQINDVVLRYYHLVYDGEWHIDFSSFQSAITERTRAIVLVHPNNPTGSYIKQREFEQVCEFAGEHRCSLLTDEVFGSYNFSSDNSRATMLSSDTPVLTFSLNGISKLLALPQLKLSWIIAHGNSSQTDEALGRLDIIADTFLSVNTPVQVALPKLLEQTSALSKQILERIQSNYQLLKNVFIDSSVSVLRSEGGWYAILQLPQMRNDDEWAIELLSRQNIFVHPGHFFDMDQKACIVVSLLSPPDLFADALSRIRLCVGQT